MPQADLSRPITPDIAVLAAWLNGNPTSDAPFLRADDFPEPQGVAIFKTIKQLESERIFGNFPALIERMKRLPQVGGEDWGDVLLSIRAIAQRLPGLHLLDNAIDLHTQARRRRLHAEYMRKAEEILLPTTPLPDDDTGAPAARPAFMQWTVQELKSMEFPPLTGPWPGVIPAGLTIIGARPKHGKSLLMLQLCAAVGAGSPLFGQKLERKPVLYYSLEDSPRRLQQRLSFVEASSDTQMCFRRGILPLNQGGISEIESAAGEFGLIVIDTISRAIPGRDFNRDAAIFGDLLGQLQTMATDHEIAIVAVVHTRKSDGREPDPVDDVLGTTQMTAAADCVLAIYKAGKDSDKSYLKGRARDLDDIDLTLHFDRKAIQWRLVGETPEVERSEKEQEVLDALQDMGKMTATALAMSMGAQRTHIAARLVKLAGRGLVCREALANRVYYYLPGTTQEGLPDSG